MPYVVTLMLGQLEGGENLGAHSLSLLAAIALFSAACTWGLGRQDRAPNEAVSEGRNNESQTNAPADATDCSEAALDARVRAISTVDEESARLQLAVKLVQCDVNRHLDTFIDVLSTVRASRVIGLVEVQGVLNGRLDRRILDKLNLLAERVSGAKLVAVLRIRALLADEPNSIAIAKRVLAREDLSDDALKAGLCLLGAAAYYTDAPEVAGLMRPYLMDPRAEIRMTAYFVLQMWVPGEDAERLLSESQNWVFGTASPERLSRAMKERGKQFEHPRGRAPGWRAEELPSAD